ncbi:DUF2235 domain-containing protein [Roseovarius spongiae]|uniref:DUF2235 domain-containing protein n=1 Tax=Roseovarius spongiae TaxID=2320272 RepID=A0A3A8AWC9_9RHOB|nr:DUF2235 domain-containing protein [Roseovarius spongiae]RKF16668.1 DUF2235 domain-containing protein [Roseovarius spongiae]
MTRIVILCDGTWNARNAAIPTHVATLSRALTSDPTRGQVVAYFAGVGTDRRFDGPVMRLVNRFGGGIFGWGLDAKVKQAYQFIAQVYRRGDEICLFGFSRGAYTARSLAGMIRKCGIARDTSPAGINAAYALYRLPGERNHPDAPRVRAERARLSPEFATSKADQEWRGDGSALVDIAYVGVWDTVGALGIPVALFGGLAYFWNRRYRFHDTDLSSLVRAARHAVALDEMRVFYAPALWSNLDDVEGRQGLNKGDTGPARSYQQVWFVGTHGIIGGSGDTPALSAYTLDWLLGGVPDLLLADGAADGFPRPDARVASDELPVRAGWLRRWRKGPKREWEVHSSVRERYSEVSDYRPGSLRL